MRGKSRVFALFSALVIIATGFVWPSMDAMITNADAGTTTEAVPYTRQKFNFDNVDVAQLDSAGFTSTRFYKGNNYAVDGTADSKVSDQWFSGMGTGTLYEGVTGVSAANIGLKPNQNDNDYFTSLNTPYHYDNFHLTTEVYWGSNTGITIGKKNTWATGTDDTSFRIYFNASQIQIVGGGLDYSTQTVTGGTGSWNAGYAPTYIFKPDKNYKSQTNAIYQLHVKLQDGVLSVWLEGYESVLTVAVSDTFKNENIALSARKYGGDDGGFKDFEIADLNATGYADFDNVDVAQLDSAGFTSTRFYKENNYAVDGTADSKVSDQWFSGMGTGTLYEGVTGVSAANIGLKPNQNDNDYFTSLNTPYHYDNFHLTTEVYWGSNTGITIGKKNTWATETDDTSFRIYFNANQIQIVGGGLDYSTQTVTGGTGSWNAGYAPTYIFKPANNYTSQKSAVYQLHVKLQDGVLSVWLEGYDSVLAVAVSDTFKNENIALSARKYGGDDGGFKTFSIVELAGASEGTTVDENGYTDFDSVSVSALEKAGFTSTRYNASDGYKIIGEKETEASSHWFSGKKYQNKISSNLGLKPNQKESDKTMTVLNTPYTYTDYRISLEVYWGAMTGIVLGEKDIFPTSSTDTSVYIYFNANQIQVVGGGIDADTAIVTGKGGWNTDYAPIYIFKPEATFTISKGVKYTLNVEMKDGVITTWVDGYDGVLSVKTTDTFKQECIALTARQYDGDGGGFKSLTVEELAETMSVSYTADEFKTYRTAEGYTSPVYKNYLFAGWYKDRECTLENVVSAEEMTVETEYVYAKFVPRYILGVKAQISAELLDDDSSNDEKADIRFVTTVDALNYSQVGFRIKYTKNDEEQTKTSVSNIVYSSLKDFGGNTYQPTQFCKISKYFKACTVRNINKDYYGTVFHVTPYWKTLDGTVVYGDTVEKTIDQGINSHYLKGKTALFVGDSIQHGFNAGAGNAQAWDRRMEQYGVISENVSKQGWALTNTDTSGRGQIVTQLDNAMKSSYDFVILEGGVNDVRINQDNTEITINWGEIQNTASEYDDSTIAGAMQGLIVKTKEKYPDAKIVYIINHYYGATEENMKTYVQMVKDACGVHDIAYVDFSDTISYPILKSLSYFNTAYIPDNLHPNDAAYALTAPILATAMRKVIVL